MIDIFNYRNLIKILKYLYLNKTARVTDISKDTNCQYSYSSKQSEVLKELGLIKKEKKGREVFVSLTDRGKEIGKRIYEIERLLK